MQIAIIDYSIGNVQSIINAISHNRDDIKIILTSEKNKILDSDAVILPGVGAFQKAMNELKKRDLPEILSEYIKLGKPLLGICLGMQLLLDSSEEFGFAAGLGFCQGEVKKFPNTTKDKLPNVSWNNLTSNSLEWENTILEGITKEDDFYFVHSYICLPGNQDTILAHSNYGGVQFCSVMKNKNIYGCQFHPEKSSFKGLMILNNFINIAEK